MQTPKQYYNTLVSLGSIQTDEKQVIALGKLDEIHKKLINYAPRKKRLSLRGVFSSAKKDSTEIGSPSGLYMHGSVGCGKTVLLKAFFETVPTDKKVYMHFHTFLLDINKRLADYSFKKVDDPLTAIADDLLADAWLYCFDECVVGDVGDAMLFGRVAGHILKNGGVVVATSNFPPDKLKPRGAGMDIFKPYVEYFFSKTNVHNMDISTDYRTADKNAEGWANYLYPLSKGTTGRLQSIVDNITVGIVMTGDTVHVRGHSIVLNHAGGDVACTNYNDLLARPYGVEDFIALADKYKTLVISGIPKIHPDNTSLAKRFILLVDAYYEAGGKIILSAECPPENLYESGAVKFEFDRCVSRLNSFNQ